MKHLKKYEKIIKILAPVLLLASLIWFGFFPQYYRLGYTMLIISAILFLLFAYLRKDEILLFIKKKSSLKGMNALISVGLALVVLSLINYTAYKHEYKVDLTRSKINTLSDQTIKVLKSLKTEIHFIAFLDPAVESASFKYAMDKYAYYTNKLSYEIVDPNKDPIKARNYNVTRYGTIIAKLGSNETIFESITEEDLTNSIIKLTRPGKKKVYFLTGHGERDIDSDDPEAYSSMKKIISGQNYIVEKLELLSRREIPEDAALVIIAGPKKAFFDKEISVLDNYINKDGSLFILSDPSSPKQMVTPNQNVNKILANVGVRLRDDVVVDPQSKLFGVTEAMPVVQVYDTKNPITAELKEVTIYPFAQSIDVSKVDNKKYDVSELCKTTPTSWGETGSKTGKIYFDADKDNKGPLDLAILISDQKNKNIVVFGNSSFVANQYVSHLANSDIFMNAVSYLVKDDDLIAIRPKKDQAGQFVMPGGFLVGVATVYMLPFSILAGGIVYWYRRRKH